MQAVLVTDHGGLEVLRCVERSVPEPGPGAVRIAVAAAGLNFADVEKRRGAYPDGPTPPYIPGMEVSGTIDAVGPGVNRDLGAFVAGICGGGSDGGGGGDGSGDGDTDGNTEPWGRGSGEGGFAEFAIVEAQRLVDVPPSLSATEAAAVPVQWHTAHNCLYEWGGLEPGETVLIHAAAGGVGSAAVQLARIGGATVVGTAGTGEKLERVRSLGADAAINYETADLAESVAAVTDGRGVDLVLDGVGGGALRASLDALADCGRIVTFGMASGRPGTVATPRLFFRNAEVLGYHLEHALEHAPRRVLSAHTPIYRLFESGRVSAQIDSVWSLAEASDAFDRLESRNSIGKVVLEP